MFPCFSARAANKEESTITSAHNHRQKLHVRVGLTFLSRALVHTAGPCWCTLEEASFWIFLGKLHWLHRAQSCVSLKSLQFYSCSHTSALFLDVVISISSRDAWDADKNGARRTPVRFVLQAEICANNLLSKYLFSVANSFLFYIIRTWKIPITCNSFLSTHGFINFNVECTQSFQAISFSVSYSYSQIDVFCWK